ncbi:hypothetical protein MKX03_027626 [Papaver bracteatum]|nr:hypothetical protein MKX03_027626 [Papaver bracteatum]
MHGAYPDSGLLVQFIWSCTEPSHTWDYWCTSFGHALNLATFGTIGALHCYYSFHGLYS